MTNKVFSINKTTEKLVDNLIENKEKFRLQVYKGKLNCTIIDAGIKTDGSIESGIKISEICLGGLGKVDIVLNNVSSKSRWSVNVKSCNPVLACLGCQYAGWSLQYKDFFSLGSGPGRSLAQREKIFKELNYVDNHNRTSLILEVDKEPPIEIIKKVSKDCNVEESQIIFILTPTTSMSGNIQIVSRVLEVALHKAHELKFPLERVGHCSYTSNCKGYDYRHG